MTTDAKLADTQRAIIESAERRGYERALAEQRAGVREQPAQCGEEIMVNAAHDVYTLPLQPSGLSSGPRFVVHVPWPEALAAAKGEVVVTRNESGEIVLVSRQDSEGRILSVIAESADGVEGWFLPASSLNSLQRVSVDAQIKRCKAAHFTNLDIRINGQNEAHEADWIKHMVKAATPKPDAVAGLVEKVRELRAFADEARDTYLGSHASGTFRAIVRQIDALAAALAAHRKGGSDNEQVHGSAD